MAQEKVGIITALFRFFRYWNWKKARGIIDAADQQFTGSSKGISAAFDMHQDKMVHQYQDLRDAIAEVEAILEDKRHQLEKLNQEETELLAKREGALSMAQKAQADESAEDYERHAAAFERFQMRIEEIEASQERLQGEITETSGTMEKYMLRLTDLQAEIQKMPQQKAEAIADFVSANRIIELNDRLQGLEDSMDRGPISAVMEANRKLTAKARISDKLAGNDVRVQDNQYAREGSVSSARSKMDAMLAARNTESKGTQGNPVGAETQDQRPVI